VDFSYEDFYSRNIPVLGAENKKRLSNRTVLVAGVGGLGTTSSQLLASMGVGHIKLVDYDVIEQSNLPRQELYTLEDVGEAKVDVASEKLSKRNPSVKISTYTISIDGLSIKNLLDDVDLIIDGLDRFRPRMTLHGVAYERKIPYIFGGAISTQGNVMSFVFRGEKPCMVCVLGNPQDNEQNTCAVRGVHPSILTIVASIQVSEAVKILLDLEPALDEKMLYFDLDTLDFDKIAFKKNPECPECKRVESKKDRGSDGEVRREKLQIKNLGEVNMSSLCGKDTFIFTPKFEWKITQDRIRSILQEHWSVYSKGKSVLVIQARGVICSLMKSGVMTIRGAGDKENALKLYSDILDLLKILWSTT